jgi:phosphatidylinositol dimannoside acyltransferase
MHMRRVTGGQVGRWRLSRMVDEAFASYARYWAESLKLPTLSRDYVLSHMRYDGYEYIQGGRDAGKGTILALPHLGGWEWAGTQLAMVGHPISVVVERLEPPELFDWFVSFREKLGMQVIPTGPRAAARCVQALADNHLLCLLSDRIVGDSAGMEVEFFGEKTMLPAGPVTLALRTGAALLRCAVYFERGSGHLGHVLPAMQLERSGRLREDVRAGTQRMANDFEWFIRRAPAQWHLMQPNWPSDLGPDGPAGTERE